MDAKGIPYSSDLITDKENTLLFIWNHGSGPDTQMDKCKKNQNLVILGKVLFLL